MEEEGKLVLLTGIAFLLLLPLTVQADESHELRLRKDLFDGRDKVATHTRPVETHDGKVVLTIHLALRHIRELNPKFQSMSASFFVNLEWTDTRLVWQPSSYGGVVNIVVPTDLIWIPDIALYNAANASDGAKPFTQKSLQVGHNGRIRWMTPAYTQSICYQNLRHFPFDQHECTVSFGSWTHHGFHLDLVKRADRVVYVNTTKPKFSAISLDDYHDNDIWELINSTTYIKQTYYDCCKEPYPTINFALTLRRRDCQYLVTVLIPAFVPIVLLLVLFTLPPSAGEKFLMGCFSFLYLLLLLVYLYWTVPRNASSIPHIVTLCSVSLALAGFSLIFSTISFSLSKTRHSSPPPAFVRRILSSGAARVLLCLDPYTVQIPSDNGDSKKVPVNHEWSLVSTAFDRCILFVYCIILTATFASLAT